MLNFSNLTAYEFELLAKDIIEKELNIKLRSYAQGRDNGIDIRGYIGNDIIIQVKHYINSSFSHLRTTLRKELPKIEKLKPKRFMIVTSFNLTPSNEDEIFELFKDFMLSKNDIVDVNFVNSFLTKESNIEILRAHNKLWLTSTNVLNLIFNKGLDLDSKCFIDDYEVKARLFVYTKAFNEALNILKDNNVIILEGAPGVGKTTLSKLLVAHFCENGYKFKYSSSNSLSEIKKGIVEKDKEIILMDNFLGQRVSDLSNHFFEEIRTLIIFASSYKDKKIIVNSRNVVLNEAININQSFRDLLYNYHIYRYDIKVDEISNFEKAQILYNHIYFNKLPDSYYREIKQDRHYLDIVLHKNFSPRIIEYVTRNEKITSIPAHEYFTYIIKTLDNPKDVWRDEFNNLLKFDRIFMYTLFSLISYDRFDQGYVDYAILKECFEIRISKENDYDSTVDNFGISVKKLEGGLIKLRISQSGTSIGFINPSVEDYIFSKLNNLSKEIEQISEAALYVEQFVNLKKVNENAIEKNIKNRIKREMFFKMKTFSNLNLNYYFLRFIFDYDCKYESIREKVYEIFTTMKAFSFEREDNANLIIDFFLEKNMFDFYKLQELLYNDNLVIKIYEYLDFSQIVKFMKLHERYIGLYNGLILSNYVSHEIGYMIGWEIELDIIHNNKSEINQGIKECLKNLNCNDYIYDEEEFKKLYNEEEKRFISEYIMPIVEEKKESLNFSTNISKNIHVRIQEILKSINFHDNVAFNSDFDEEIDYSKYKNSHMLQDDSEAITNLFNIEYTTY
ncbi:hypothetical protein [Clostridium butyricum]|uniref:nSTAND3 domain-containing NTPase n=1 Tax=Clostridium butyricum TaxID=1492 RepID=UPI0013D6C6BB|nr:hypothetical protein [Clostridium butyricum]MCQ2019503.1 hypothetical protein [Clostridium butyricum]NFB72213.1 hypothetical protein [Clostridium butyricum]NFB90156.1 hypothetical protein [Clostridium butyricum]UTY53008.1 hypothetical protein HNS01_07840 [Clostridium butyricum]